MSRSRKKHPGGGIAVADSDKPYKVAEHRRERREMASRLRRLEQLNGLGYGFDATHPLIYGNPYLAPKDGKQYWTGHDDRWMRK